MTKIYFIRHGESEANAAGVIAGGSESPLTEKGIAQAHHEAAVLREKNVVIDTIISSPLSRAYDTAVIIAEEIGYSKDAIVIVDDLSEKVGGTFEGGPIGVLYAAPPDVAKAAGAESFDEFAARMRRANKVVLEKARGTTLVVAHAGVHRMAQCLAQGLSPSEMPNMEKVPNGVLMAYPLARQ